jgi:hypothetical protein
VKGPHRARGFRLTCGLNRLLLYIGGERGTIVPGGLHTMVANLVKIYRYLHAAVLLLGKT